MNNFSQNAIHGRINPAEGGRVFCAVGARSDFINANQCMNESPFLDNLSLLLKSHP